MKKTYLLSVVLFDYPFEFEFEKCIFKKEKKRKENWTWL